MHSLRLTLIFVLLACGGRARPPKPPPPLEPKQLAELLHADLIQLGEIAQRQRGKCVELTADLRPHIARMKIRKTDVEHMLRDQKQATELKAELAPYADRVRGLTDKIAADLGATYLTCPGESNDPQSPRYQLERLISSMPTFE